MRSTDIEKNTKHHHRAQYVNSTIQQTSQHKTANVYNYRYRYLSYTPPPPPPRLRHPHSPLPHFSNHYFRPFSRFHYVLCLPLPPHYRHLGHEQCCLCHSPGGFVYHPTDPHSLNSEGNTLD